MDKIKTIVRKEWAEVFKNRMVLFTVAFLPLILTALPLVMIYTTRGSEMAAGSSTSTELPGQFRALCPPNLKGGECFQMYMVSQFMMMFMLIPVAIPGTIAAYSIVGEKTTRSLEPLLATPISTFELLAGKSLAAVIPAIIATYGAFLIYAVGAWILISNKVLFWAMMDARWLLAIFLVGPLMAVCAILFAVMVSSRVNDPRVAEQFSMVLIVPVLAVFFGQISGLFLVSRNLVMGIAVVMVLVDIGLAYAAVQLFQREAILTRWK